MSGPSTRTWWAIEVVSAAVTCAVAVPSVWAAMTASSTVLAQSAQSRLRVLRWDPDVPIASRLLPDDVIVDIRNDGDLFITHTKKWTVKQVVENATVNAEFVAVVDVNTVDSVLVSNGSWIHTRLMGTVRDILPGSKNRRISRGQRLEVHFPVGEMVFGNVLVRAGGGDPLFVPKLPAGRSYLMFIDNENGRYGVTHAPVLIEHGKLVYPWPVVDVHVDALEPPHPLQGLTVQEVAKIVRDAKSPFK